MNPCGTPPPRKPKAALDLAERVLLGGHLRRAELKELAETFKARERYRDQQDRIIAKQAELLDKAQLRVEELEKAARPLIEAIEVDPGSALL